MPNIEYIMMDEQGLDAVGSLWEKLREHHRRKAGEFAEFFTRVNYAQRKEGLLKTAAAGKLRVDLARDSGIGRYVGYCVTSLSADNGRAKIIFGRGGSVMIEPGATLALIRRRKPLVHQITNYVVMNETANATLALGALPVMAHAREEVEEMVNLASALVINIGTLSPAWVESMLLAGRAANRRGIPVVLDPVGAGATSYRTETARRLLGEVKVAVLRGNAGEIASLVGIQAEVRGVESIGATDDRQALARRAATTLGLVASVTGPVDFLSDGTRAAAVANGHPLLATVTGTGCIATALTGCFLAAKPADPFEAATEALVALGVAGEDAAVGSPGPGTFHVRLYDALAALDPATLGARTRVQLQ